MAWSDVRLATFAIAGALMMAGASGAVAGAEPAASRNDGNHSADDCNHRADDDDDRADAGSVRNETGDYSASTTTRGSAGSGERAVRRSGDDQTSSGAR